MAQRLIILMFCISVALMMVSVGLAIKADFKWFSDLSIVCSWIAASINVHSFIRLVKPYGVKASVEIKEPSGKLRTVLDDPRNGRMSIRWKRGFFRAWVVFAVLWIAAAAWVQTRPPVPTADDYFADIVGPLTPSGCENMGKAYPNYDVEACVERSHGLVRRVLMWALLPPVLIRIVSWVVGSVVAWTIQGFRP